MQAKHGDLPRECERGSVLRARCRGRIVTGGRTVGHHEAAVGLMIPAEGTLVRTIMADAANERDPVIPEPALVDTVVSRIPRQRLVPAVGYEIDIGNAVALDAEADRGEIRRVLEVEAITSVAGGAGRVVVILLVLSLVLVTGEQAVFAKEVELIVQLGAELVAVLLLVDLRPLVAKHALFDEERLAVAINAHVVAGKADRNGGRRPQRGEARGIGRTGAIEGVAPRLEGSVGDVQAVVLRARRLRAHAEDQVVEQLLLDGEREVLSGDVHVGIRARPAEGARIHVGAEHGRDEVRAPLLGLRSRAGAHILETDSALLGFAGLDVELDAGVLERLEAEDRGDEPGL